MIKIISQLTSITVDHKWVRIIRIMLFIFMVLSVVYIVGFAQHPTAHNTFHEVRHGLGLPCH
ncbi:hypothetical protein LCGC14_2042920 [marine sediment metagenome]|uniref:Cobalt transporter subunit CbtB n=1 Tax=marine sediment metagenome TaxID=412755 RepID=A0A0F9FDW0_9ZZZZ